MARQVQLRRGTTAQTSTFTGAVAEVTVDTDKNTVVIHDGSTAGGHPITSDQTVVLTEGSNVTITGTYPNFTIASTDNNTTYSAGTGIDLAGTTFNIDSTVVTSSYTGDIDVTGELIADSYNETYAAVTSTSNAATVNCENANSFSHTLTENTTFTFSNPPASGIAYAFSLEIIQDASGSGFTVTWPTSVDFPAATAPTLTADADAVDVFVFTTRDGGATWYGFTAGQAIATPV